MFFNQFSYWLLKVPTHVPTGLLVLQLFFRNSLSLMFSASPSALLISKVLPKTLLNFIEFFPLCESRNIPFALPPMLFAQTVDLSVLTNVTPARLLLDIRFACTSTMSLECAATPMLFGPIKFCSTTVFVVPVIKTAILFPSKVTLFTFVPSDPVTNMPAWKLRYVPGPTTVTRSEFGTTIPTLELSGPGPVIE